MKVLVFTAYYFPGYKAGGPIQSIVNMISHLGDEIDFSIVTTDRDSGDQESYPGVTSARWKKVGKASVLYLSREDYNIVDVIRLINKSNCEIIYLNSFFSRRFSIIPILSQQIGLSRRKKLIMAPRGEFSPSALALKARRKHAYITILKLLGVHRKVLWHVSSEYEAEDIKAVFGDDLQIRVASNLPRVVPNDLVHIPRLAGQPLRVLFLSRISPMKNLKFALECLQEVAVPIVFTIAGPISSALYWGECQSLIEKLPSFVQVDYQGFVESADVPATIARNDLFFLPTLGENFGHVIIESLASGTPVLISDRTPWRNLELVHCGWDLSLANHRGFISKIEEMFCEDAETATGRRGAAVQYARQYSEESSIFDDARKLFESVPS